MGVKCQIVRDSNDRVIAVEAPNGNSSTLFNKLLNIVQDERKALDLWAYSYSDEFNNIENTATLDKNGEHKAETVLKHVANQISSSGLSREDYLELYSSFGHMPFSSLEQLYKVLNSTLTNNGVFSLDLNKMVKSGLFSKQEVSGIINNKRTADILYKLLADIKSELEKPYQNTAFQDLFNSKSTDEYSFVSNEVGKFGKVKRNNPGEIMDIIFKKLVGSKDKNEFIERLSALPYPGFVTSIINDTKKLDLLFKQVSSKMIVPFMTIGPDGTIQEKTSPDTFNNLVNSLVTGVDNHVITSNIDILSNISKEVWDENEKEVKGLLNKIAKKASEIGLDVYDLEKMYDNKPHSDVINFLNSLAGFTSDLEFKTASFEDIKRFSEIYNEFFSIEETEQSQVIDKIDGNIIYLPDNVDELTAFTELGLVKVKDGFYQKVERESDYISVLYEMFVSDTSSLPKAAVKSTLDRNGNVSVNKAGDETRVKQDISNFIRERAKSLQIYNNETQKDVEELVAFKTAFNHPISETQSIDLSREFNKMSVEGLNIEYLTGEFLKDFAKEKAEQRSNNSILYNNVLRHFEIGASGIRLINTDENTKSIIRFSTPDNGVYGNLKKYAALSKSNDLTNLFEYKKNNLSPGTAFLRNLYVNNPNLLSRYTGKMFSEGNNVHLPNMTDNFVRIGNHVLERIGEYGNMGVYGLVSSITDPNFNIINKNITVSSFSGTPINEQVRGTSQTNLLKINKLASKNELNNIIEDIDGCN